MPAIKEKNNLGDVLKYEAPNLYSRESATVAAGQHLLIGTVVGRDPANGKLSLIDPAADDASKDAIGILANDIDATTADRHDAVLITRHAVVASHALIWPAGITAPQKTTAIAQLRALGILIRTSA